MMLQCYYPLFPSFPWLWCFCTACNPDFPSRSLLFLRVPTPAPQVVPVRTRLMTSAPPVCIFGCKNSKEVIQNEKCFPSGYVVFSILTTTPQRRRMSVEEEEVVLEILCETSFEWQHSVTVPESSALYWLPNSLIFWQISSPSCCLSSLDIGEKPTKGKGNTWHVPPWHGDTNAARVSSQQMGSCSPPRRTFWPQWPEFWSCVPDYFLSCCWLLRPIAMENKTFISAISSSGGEGSDFQRHVWHPGLG